MAKRLRGWRLEYESGIQPKAKASTALEKAKDCETESVLANKLLFLWARGQLSATLIRELADCALAGGANHRDLVAIAQAGNWGAQPSNVHKQIMSQFCASVEIAASFDVWVPCTHPKTNKDALEKASIFLPHMMFAALGQNYPKCFPSFLALEKASWQSSGNK